MGKRLQSLTACLALTCSLASCFPESAELYQAPAALLLPRATTTAPSCAASSNSANGRRIGYYQLSNLQRPCDTVSVSQIDTTGLTHLYVAFADFSPTNYSITADSREDISAYSNFTALKSDDLQIWIVIGGYSFSDPGTSTFSAWSNMTSTSDNRATFISSLKSFMSTHGFQGADLDWEFPGVASRGGSSQDTANFVSLVHEMRTSFGSDYGISLTIPTAANYISQFDIPGMAPYVDFFGFMAYDLASYSTSTPYVAGQTDIRVITESIGTLVSAGANLTQFNLGLAAYGRGYTLANTTCNYIGCNATGPSVSGTCTNTSGPGVTSLTEINSMLMSNTSLLPRYDPASHMMQLNYSGNQWIAYDDVYTFSLKKEYASGMCFGGTMMWSVDLDGGSGGDIPILARTTTGHCGRQNNYTICAQPYGSCCSGYGFCGNGTEYCSAGCQSGDCEALPELHDGQNITTSTGSGAGGNGSTAGSGGGGGKSAAGRLGMSWGAAVFVALGGVVGVVMF